MGMMRRSRKFLASLEQTFARVHEHLAEEERTPQRRFKRLPPVLVALKDAALRQASTVQRNALTQMGVFSDVPRHI
jgi:hypothetical protein